MSRTPNPIAEALRDWRLVRSETMELLDVLSDDNLSFVPEGDKWQPLYYQFACMGRTQLVYAQALATGIMDFTSFGDPTLPNTFEQNTAGKLRALFKQAEVAWQKAAKQHVHAVQWPETHLSAAGQVYRLISHERLHHGQIISYFTMAGIDLPLHFKANWAL